MTGILTIPAAEYHADQFDAGRPSLSASLCATICSRSPAHARANHPRLNPAYKRDDDQKFDVGTATHALLLEGRTAVQVVAATDWRTADARAMRDEARAAGLVPLLPDQWDAVQEMADAVREQIGALDVDPPLLTDGLPEQTLVWEMDGILCRARLDWLRDDHQAIDDLKTTSRSANPETWARKTLWSIGADVQAAFYLRGLRAVSGANAVFRWVVCETSAPYAVSVVSLAPDAMALADAKVDYALNVWKRCLETGVWPGYPTRVCWAEAPGWLEADWLEKEAREAA